MKSTTKNIIIGIIFYVIISSEVHIIRRTAEMNIVSGATIWQYISFFIAPVVFVACIYFGKVLKEKSKPFYIILTIFIPSIFTLNLIMCVLNIFIKFV